MKSDKNGKSNKGGKKSKKKAGLGAEPVAMLTSAVAEWSRAIFESVLDSDAAGKSGKSSKKSGKGGKVTICHKPPGNPSNMHTISVGAPATDAHLAHGDKLGECGNEIHTEPSDPVSFELSDDAHIVYSSRALKSLEDLLEQIRLEEDGINVRRTSEAPRKLSNELKSR